MIVTKAYITKTPEDGDNIFEIRAPLFEDNTNEEAILNATLCSSPESFNGFNVGDCVFVSFENNRYDNAIILGKLYVNIPETSTVYGIMNELKVTGKVVLPDDTTIGGYSAKDIFTLFQAASSQLRYTSVREW